MNQDPADWNDLDLRDIDRINILSEHDSRRIAAKIGLVCTLYVSGSDSTETRSKLAACGDEYLAMFGSHVRLHQDPSGRGKMKAFPRHGVSLSRLAREITSDEPFTPSFTGSDHVRDASSYSLFIFSPGTEHFAPGEVPDSISATFPIDYVLDRAREAAQPSFQDWVYRWCQRLNPESGYAGLGILQSVDFAERRRTIRQVSALALRFPGLEVDDPIIVGNHVGGHIKGVNWLTAISHGLLERIGGKKTIEDGLDHHAFPLRDYGGGVLIQAGPSPQIGDVNRRSDLGPYRAVSSLLRPLRMEFPDNDSLLNLNDDRGTELTNEWLARFD